MSNHNSILLIDPAFDPEVAPSCCLLVKIGLDHLSYAIINKESNRIHVVFDEQECENVGKKFSDRLASDSHLSLPYREVKIAVATENKIDVPLALYQEEDSSAYSQFFPAPHTGNLYAYAQRHFGLVTLFTLPNAIDQLLTHEFAKSKNLHATAGLLSIAERVGPNAFIFDFSALSFTVIYVLNGKLIFQQSYEIENISEFNYFLLLIINQLNIVAREVTVYLSGIIHQGDSRYECLTKYFETLRFIMIDQRINQEVLEDMPAHYYSSLLALDQCE